MSYESIMAGTEVQAVKENFAKLRAEVIAKIETLTGQEAKAKSLMDEDRLHSVQGHIENAIDDAEKYCIDNILAKAEAEGLA